MKQAQIEKVANGYILTLDGERYIARSLGEGANIISDALAKRLREVAQGENNCFVTFEVVLSKDAIGVTFIENYATPTIITKDMIQDE